MRSLAELIPGWEKAIPSVDWKASLTAVTIVSNAFTDELL